MKDINLPWDRYDDIETYFVKANKLEENLQDNYGIKCSTGMKIMQTENDMYWSNMLYKEELMAWEEKNNSEKMWVHL